MRMRKDSLAAVFLLLCAGLAGYYLIAGYGAHLDSDMASELALARHLAQKGALVSSEWRYSTEVRLLNTQLVFTPLMALAPNNWRLVRTAGCIVLMLLMAASCYGCARTLGAARRYAMLFAGVGMLPCSAVYAQMITTGAYYVPHAILINLYVACLARMMRPEGRRLRALALMLLAAVMGASSIRYLLGAMLPAACACVYMAVFSDRPLARGDRRTPLLAAALLAAVAGVAGYVLGTRALSAWLGWNEGYDARRLIGLFDVQLFSQLDTALDGLLHLIGYRDRRYLFSAQGLLSVGAIGLLGLGALLTARACARREEEEDALRFGALTLAVSGALTLFTFLFVENLYLNRYWLPVMTLGMPVMAVCLTRERNAALRRLSALAFAVVLLGLSAAQVRDSMADPQIGQDDLAVAAALEESGMTFGYATFWNATVFTELTDGRVEVVAMQIEPDGQGRARPVMGSWLELKEDARMNRPDEPVFLLLDSDEAGQLSDYLADAGARRQEIPGSALALYRLDSQRTFFRAMEENAPPGA